MFKWWHIPLWHSFHAHTHRHTDTLSHLRSGPQTPSSNKLFAQIKQQLWCDMLIKLRWWNKVRTIRLRIPVSVEAVRRRIPGTVYNSFYQSLAAHYAFELGDFRRQHHHHHHSPPLLLGGFCASSFWFGPILESTLNEKYFRIEAGESMHSIKYNSTQFDTIWFSV